MLYKITAETNTRFAQICITTMKVFGYTTNDFDVVILAYLVIIHIFKVILVIQ